MYIVSRRYQVERLPDGGVSLAPVCLYSTPRLICPPYFLSGGQLSSTISIFLFPLCFSFVPPLLAFSLPPPPHETVHSFFSVQNGLAGGVSSQWPCITMYALFTCKTIKASQSHR